MAVINQYNLITIFLLFAVANAFIVNILSISLPFFSLGVCLFFFVFLWKRTYIHFKFYHWYYVIIAFTLLYQIFIYSIFGEINQKKEILYHVNVSFMVLFFTFFYSKHAVEDNISNVSMYLIVVLSLYVIVSFYIHYYHWEAVANILSEHDDLLDLKMDGFIPRMYGLLFNPLTQSFTFLYLFFFLYLSGFKKKIVYVLLGLVIFFSFVRTAILIFFVFLLYLSYKKFNKITKIMLLIFLLFLVLELLLFVQSIDFSLDNTGSIREHFSNVILGLHASLNFYGYGFVSPEILGAWNVRLEGFTGQFAFNYGFMGILLVIMLHIPAAIITLKKKNLDGVVVLVLMFLTANLFPIYTFQFAFFMYLLLLQYIVFRS